MNFSALWPTKYASSPIDVAHAMPPSAFQNRNVGHDIRVAPAIHAAVMRSPVDPAPEEDRLRAVTVEERLADRDHAGGGGAGTGPARSSSRAAEPAADARSRRCRPGSRRTAATAITASIDRLPAARDDAGGDQRGLARHRDAHRLDGDEQEDDRAGRRSAATSTKVARARAHPASSMLAVPALTITARDAGSRARAGRPAHRARRGPHARVRAAGDEGDGQGPAAGRGRRPRLRHRPRQHVPPVPRPRPRADRALRRPARVHGLGRADRHRLRRLPGLLDGPRHGRRRDQGPRAARAASARARILAIEEDGVRFRSYLDGSERFMAPETSMEIQAALGSDLALVFDECTPFHVDARVHGALDRAHAPLARPLPGLARRARPATASSSTGSSRAASTRTCASSPRRRSPPASATASRSAARSAPTRPQMYEVVGWTTAALPEDRPRHLLGIGEIDDLVRGVELGIDTFDCAMPTRLGPPRDGARARPRAAAGASTSRQARWRDSDEPLMEGCPCPACALGFTRGYLRYLAHARELTGHAPAHAAQPRVRRARDAPAARGDRHGGTLPAGRRPHCAAARRPDVDRRVTFAIRSAFYERAVTLEELLARTPSCVRQSRRCL